LKWVEENKRLMRDLELGYKKAKDKPAKCQLAMAYIYAIERSLLGFTQWLAYTNNVTELTDEEVEDILSKIRGFAEEIVDYDNKITTEVLSRLKGARQRERQVDYLV